MGTRGNPKSYQYFVKRFPQLVLWSLWHRLVLIRSGANLHFFSVLIRALTFAQAQSSGLFCARLVPDVRNSRPAVEIDRLTSHDLWRHWLPLGLASRSAGRRMILEQVGVPFTLLSASVDERALEAEVVAKGGGADDIATHLAASKALAAQADPEQFVLGADQIASCEGRCFGKPINTAAAKDQLAFLSGRTHRLHSAVALAKGGKLLFQTVAHADLKMRLLSAPFIDAYVKALGEAVLTTAGAYQIEGLGAHLFETVTGDHWTIVGLPILPVLDVLRGEGALLS
jgi:septum formation protein